MIDSVMVPNAAVDAVARNATSVHQGVAAQSVAAPAMPIAHGAWATLEPQATWATREGRGPQIKVLSDYSETSGQLRISTGCDMKRAWTRGFGIERVPLDPSVAILHALGGCVKVFVNGQSVAHNDFCVLRANDSIRVTAGARGVRGSFTAITLGQSDYSRFNFVTETVCWTFQPDTSSERAFAIMAAGDPALQRAYLTALADRLALRTPALVSHVDHSAAKLYPLTGTQLQQLDHKAKRAKAPQEVDVQRHAPPMDEDGFRVKKRARGPQIVD